MILRIVHASLLVSNTQQAVAFYQDILGFTLNINRPNLGYPGAWFDIGYQQLHLLELPKPYNIESRPKHGGHDRHIAFCVDDISLLEARLIRAGISFTRSKSGRPALFVYDPDENALEFVKSTELNSS